MIYKLRPMNPHALNHDLWKQSNLSIYHVYSYKAG